MPRTTPPVSGLARIEPLVDLAAGAGVRVEVARTGPPRRVPAVVDLSAYRVLGDALAGVVRGRAATATVAISYEPGALVVQVDDDGPGVHADMEEAIALAAEIGGGVKAAPAADGFRVRAWLPTEAQPPLRAAPPAAR